MKAYEQGAADYYAGRHMNPYSYSKEGEDFRAWIMGYRTAKDIDNFEEDRKLEIRQEELSKFDPRKV